MADPEGGDRKSVATPPLIITDPIERAKKEASNGLRQFDAVIEYIEQARSEQLAFKLRPSTLLSLNRFALEGISRFVGNYRPAAIEIIGSQHQPPPVSAVPGLVEELCEYVNENFSIASALHLAAYVMWRLNWVHPFDDGNGRTARAASYLLLCVKLGSRLPGKPTIPDPDRGRISGSITLLWRRPTPRGPTMVASTLAHLSNCLKICSRPNW